MTENNIDWQDLTDEELVSRLSKGGTSGCWRRYSRMPKCPPPPRRAIL